MVIQGGGNDASRGATDEQISANAERLIASVRQRYPEARLAMVGTPPAAPPTAAGAAPRWTRRWARSTSEPFDTLCWAPGTG